MHTTPTVSLSPGQVATMLADFLNWYYDPSHEDRRLSKSLAIAEAFLAQAGDLVERYRTPRLVGYCAYCAADMHEDEWLFKRLDGTGWIWVCDLCAPEHLDAVRAWPGDALMDTVEHDQSDEDEIPF